jgi:hypothetical protein
MPARVACGKIDPEWQGWIWCTRVDGRSAWIPDRIVARAERSTEGRTLEDYDSTELTAKAGETLVILAAESGWAWAENASGLRGWIPESYLD